MNNTKNITNPQSSNDITNELLAGLGSTDSTYQTAKKTVSSWQPAPTPRGEVGWICPVCGRGLAPSTAYCPCHVNSGITYINTTPTDNERIFKDANPCQGTDFILNDVNIYQGTDFIEAITTCGDAPTARYAQSTSTTTLPYITKNPQ